MNRRFWVEVRVSYDGVTEKGEKTNMKNTWLVRADTFAEAESRATEKVCAYDGCVENVGVEACVKRNIDALWVSSLNGELGKFYKVRCEGLLVNAKTGKERIVKRKYLILSPNMIKAYETLFKCMRDSEFSKIEVLDINLTPIVEVLSDQE